MKSYCLCLAACLMLAASGVLAQEPAPAGGAQAEPAVAAAPATPSLSPFAVMPECISTYGDRVDNLFFLILWITTAMLVLVFVLFAVFVVKYRHKDGRRAVYTHGSNKLEVFWTTATAAVLIFLVFAQRATWSEIKEKNLDSLENPFLVRVFAEQFAWHFVYPGADGKFETNSVRDVFAGLNPVGLKDPQGDVYSQILTVPVNRPVILELNSLGKYNQETEKELMGVLHSFFSPHLRLKHDIVPFYPQRIWFQARKTGNFEIACAELCGLGHYTMRTEMHVLEEAELAKTLGYDPLATKASFNAPR